MAMVTRTKAPIPRSRELASSKTLARYNSCSAEKRLPPRATQPLELSKRVDRGSKPLLRPGDSTRQPDDASLLCPGASTAAPPWPC